jgi:EamA domain-containing membrane protein RarD
MYRNKRQRLVYEATTGLAVETVALAVAAVIWGFFSQAGSRLAQRALGGVGVH